MTFRTRTTLAALAAVLLLPVAHAGAQQPAFKPFEQALPIPEVLTQGQLDIRMRESEVQLLPGAKTRMWTYNGTFPGPTIRRPAGGVTKVRFTNDLPQDAGEMTVHFHGGHNTSRDDGQPHQAPDAGPGGPLIAPGASKVYRWDHVEEGRPERAAFEWYHDHRMDLTGRNVWNGLAGMFILDDELDRSLPLPKGDFDVPLMVVDRKLDANNQLTYPEPLRAGDLTGLIPGTGKPPTDEVTGDLLIVNGAVQPHFDVAARKYRLRLLNASNFRTFDFRLPAGMRMVQIATESGLLPRPVERDVVSLGPAERAEVIVDFAGMKGRKVVLDSGAGSLMQFRVVRNATDRSRIPDQLRPAPQYSAEQLQVVREFDFALGYDSERRRLGWLINQRPYDHTRVDATPRVGAVETWRLLNTASNNVPHYIHIHGVDWKVISRDGRTPPPEEAGLKETVKVNPGEQVLVTAKFTDHLGEFVFHCHMLEHEDNGMMGNFRVEDPDGTAPQPIPGNEKLQNPENQDGAGNIAVRFTRPPASLRPGNVNRFRLLIRNTGATVRRDVRVSLRVPAGFRVVKGRRRASAKQVVVRLGDLKPGARRIRTVRLAVPSRFSTSRVRLIATLRGLPDNNSDDDTARLNYRVGTAKGRASARAASSRSSNGLVCVLEQ